jgi:hypothetical protein
MPFTTGMRSRNFIDLTGHRFGKLLVTERDVNTSHGETTWKCLCDCGKVNVVSSGCLRRRNSTSCGCYRSTQITRRNEGRPYFWIHTTVKNAAKISKREFTLTYDDILEFVKCPSCHYCGEPIIWNIHQKTNSKSHGYHLDRKNNSVGYVKSNCVVCCSLCNSIKSNKLSYDEMLKLGTVVGEIQRKRRL